MHLLGCQKAHNQIFWYKPHRFCCYDGITLILPSYKKQLFSFSWINTLKDSLNNIKHYLLFDIWNHIPKLSKRKHSQANIFFPFTLGNIFISEVKWRGFSWLVMSHRSHSLTWYWIEKISFYQWNTSQFSQNLIFEKVSSGWIAFQEYFNKYKINCIIMC